MSAVRRLADALRAAAAPGHDLAPGPRPTDITAAAVRTAARTETFHRPSRHERASVRSTVMYAVHEQLARQTWHEASTEARRVRLVRAVRAERRARRAERSAAQALEVAQRATERVVLV